MFREMIRKNKQLSREECVKLLKTEKRGVLSVIGDGGYPYGMPMNHYYNDSDGNIYFHCGKIGHRLDSLKENDKVSFCVYDKGYANDGEWALNVKSVIVFGRVEIIDDINVITDIATDLSLKFTSDMEYIQNEIEQYAKKTLILKLIPENICGKLVKES
ncbi:MAG: pyridoxamine 5'-phosphate oxidase family protein [Ruminococcaceae bacterium]|nr:pyridoxamine 5'-phosphate oxidase family protein [Oscillospiraceae bacterium]